jgi:hypothetical protein
MEATMAQARLSMRKLKEMARLRYEAGRTLDEIAASAGVARSTVQTALERMAKAGVSWPWPADVDEVVLHAQLYPNRPGPKPVAALVLPDLAAMRQQLARKGVTRRLLWCEYREQQPEGMEYSQFCEVYRRWRKTQDAVMRFSHEPGDKLFVDYAGVTLSLIDRHTGELRPLQIFVATLGCGSSPAWAVHRPSRNVGSGSGECRPDRPAPAGCASSLVSTCVRLAHPLKAMWNQMSTCFRLESPVRNGSAAGLALLH